MPCRLLAYSTFLPVIPLILSPFPISTILFVSLFSLLFLLPLLSPSLPPFSPFLSPPLFLPIPFSPSLSPPPFLPLFFPSFSSIYYLSFFISFFSLLLRPFLFPLPSFPLAHLSGLSSHLLPCSL
jgi:hypothetical protein